VNTRDDAIAQLATLYEQSQIAYFRHLIDLIVRHHKQAFWISSMNAASAVAHVQDASKRLTGTEAEVFLHSLVKDGWLRSEYVVGCKLTRSRHNYFSLGIRSITELRPYIVEEYGGEDGLLETCHSCRKEIMSPNVRLPFPISHSTIQTATIPKQQLTK